MTDQVPSIEPFEGRGYFLQIPFEEEENPTVLYVAHKDFESLQGLIENPDASWKEFREEVFSLLEHSGHDEDHDLSQSQTEKLMDLVEQEDLPEEPDIEDPLEDLNDSDGESG